ncbi:MAG: LysR family transcriptional regulator [Oscillospiraceae bacterium]
MLDFRIETFLVLCKNLNYTRTSEILNITQPTVTGHVKYLEQLYGCKLFDYNGKKLSLTEKGQMLYEFSVQMRCNALDIEKHMKSGEREKTRLNLGATKTIGDYVLPHMLKKYMDKHPENQVNVVVDNTSRLLNMLDNGEIDFAFVEGFFDKSRYDYELMRREKFIGVCSPKSNLANKEVTMEQLFGQRIILREEGSGTRFILEQVLGEHSFSTDNFKDKMTISNFSSIKQLVCNDNGITFVYLPVVEEEINRGELCVLKIKDCTITREFNFVCLKNSIFRKYYKIY